MVRENAVLTYLVFIFACKCLMTVMGHFKNVSVASNRSCPLYENLGGAFQDICESQNHGLIELLGLDGTLKLTLFQPLWHRQGTFC